MPNLDVVIEDESEKYYEDDFEPEDIEEEITSSSTTPKSILNGLNLFTSSPSSQTTNTSSKDKAKEHAATPRL